MLRGGLIVSDYDDLVREINGCEKCELSRDRQNAVPGEGSLDAEIMFIGEGPGRYEDRDGRPFVGPAGHLLDEMLAAIGLKRHDVYIANMLKCRPPRNRDPLPSELDSCTPYLDRQIEIISPSVIVCLGRFSFSNFFPNETISKARGRPRRWRDIVVFPMYHPAAALHNPKLKPAIQKDFESLPGLIERVKQAAAKAQVPDPPDPAKQLSMFD
ncbi:MAG: uracil-DNA glycosylase [SAR202 cluster bacterium]|nr:uracil-DNA glycosylase [SAR202 cluster bacterium]MDP6299787.1 uracil-DNA glycosylase [SAR202 cluster bacterium]MDP7102522.1 uracil-DNA glycosylase [SAR202 cluster bacterium]MDP7533281.1 uracil-DNA glycosylase [SAR202 cluster bacterium]